MALDESRELSVVRRGDTPEVADHPLWSFAGRQAELLLPALSSSSSRRSRACLAAPWLPTGELLTASCGVKGCPLGTGPGSPARFATTHGQAISQGLSKHKHTGGFLCCQGSSQELGSRIVFPPSTEPLLESGSLETAPSCRRSWAMGEDTTPVLMPLMRSSSHSPSVKGWVRPPHNSEQPQRILLSLLVEQALLLPSPAAGRVQCRLYVVFYQTFL